MAIDCEAAMSARPLVVVTDYLAEAGPEQEILGGLADLKLLQSSNEAEVARHITAADILLVYHDIKLSEVSIGNLAKGKAIIRCGVGVDNIDLEAAGKRGIVV